MTILHLGRILCKKSAEERRGGGQALDYHGFLALFVDSFVRATVLDYS